MANRPRKIAYIRRGLFSHTNTRVQEILSEQFPEFELIQIDIEKDILRHHPVTLALNAWHVFRLYGWEIFRKKRSIRDCFFRTPFIFRRIQHHVRRHLEPRRSEFAFTIQTQSLYDASVPGLPHFVYTDHTHLTNLYYPGFDPSRLFPRDWVDLEKEIYQNATRVFVMSNHVARSITEHYGIEAGRVTCIHAGNNVRMTPKALENDEFRNQRILFVGIDWERKGGPELLRAFEKVRAAVPGATLTIVGASPQVTVEGVTVLGRVPLEEVVRQFLRTSVFCMPSRVEPFGIAPIEALAHGVPVVATRIGALPDIVQHGETGLLVPSGDVPALADALISLLNDPERCRRFGERGKQFVSEIYTWKSVGVRLRAGIARELNLTT